MSFVVRREVVIGVAALVVASPLAHARKRKSRTIWFRDKPEQGALMVGRAPPGSKVWVGGRSVRVTEGLFAFGFGRDDTKAIAVRVVFPDGASATRKVTPARRTFEIQRINGLPENLVTPPEDIEERIVRENALVAQARARDSDEIWFAEKFDWPARGPISGVYGSQRILDGEPKSPHYGVDIAAPEGAPVSAPVNAIVTLAEPDFYLTGGTVVLDHGHGVSTTYLHMSRVDTKVGETLKRGDAFGAVGHKGRATGPHLHWAMNWFQVRLDPSLVASSPAPSKA
jgi:murein DD-endopeptidase MepM/ murein hydrolase activator NlpD